MLIASLPNEVVSALEQLPLSLKSGREPKITEGLEATLLKGGKKLRPALVLLTGRLLGLSIPRLLPFARASELIHAATLAHDDVIDDSQMRRLNPTLNARHGNTRAVLSGDFLLARVIGELALQGELGVMQALARTVEDLVEGEWAQLDARGSWTLEKKTLERIALQKTSSLFRWCCTTPALLAGLEDLRPLEDLSDSLGLAFQMIDDVLDFSENAEKPFALDFREGLVNFVSWEMGHLSPAFLPALQQGIQRGERKLHSLYSEPWPWTETLLQEALQSVRDQARAHLKVAEEVLGTWLHGKLLDDEQKRVQHAFFELIHTLGARVI
jgi:geranylgeranyl pyrophosphate synthase